MAAGSNGKNGRANLPGKRRGPNKRAGETGPNLWPSKRFTRKLKADVVVALAKRFKPAEVCHAYGISLQTYGNHLRKDAEFAAAVEEARALYKDFVAGVIHDRSVEGWDEPVYGTVTKETKDPKTGKITKTVTSGAVVGHVRRYDHKLLLALARRIDPSWKERLEVEQKTEHSGFVVGDASLADLTKEGRAALRKLLLEEQTRQRG